MSKLDPYQSQRLFFVLVPLSWRLNNCLSVGTSFSMMARHARDISSSGPVDWYTTLFWITGTAICHRVHTGRPKSLLIVTYIRKEETEDEEEKIQNVINDAIKTSSGMEQGRIHGSISRERWAGALMEVKSLFGLNSAVKKKCVTERPTDGPTDGPSYSDAWTHLIKAVIKQSASLIVNNETFCRPHIDIGNMSQSGLQKRVAK